MLQKLDKNRLLLTAVILIASVFRLYRLPDYMEFLGDQGRDVVIIRDFLKNGNFFFIGPQTSIGNMYLGPYYYYLIAPSLFLANYSPVGPAVFIALTSVLTVYLLYLIGKKWFNPQVGIISAFLFAISPVVIKYSTFSWNPNIIPLFSLLFVYFMIESRYILASLAFIMCLNSHYLALLLLPVALIIWIKNNHRTPKDLSKNLRNTFFAICIFILSLIPQILFDIKHRGQNINAIINFFTYRETTVSIKPYKAIPNLFPLFTQINTRLLTGKNTTFGLIISLYILISLVFTFHRSPLRFKIIALWYFIGLVGLGLYKQHIYDHYFGFLFPAVFLLFGYLITQFYKPISLIFLLLAVIFSIIENPWRYGPNRQLPITQQIVNSIIHESAGKPFNLALLAKQNYDPPYRYLFYELKALLLDAHLQITDQLFVICEPWQIKCEPINNPQWEIASFGWSKIEKQWQIEDRIIFKLVHNPKGTPTE